MSYLEKIEYEIVPKESFPVLRVCSGCGRKAHFINTKKFRVNANGNRLDIWLIYQCEECKHPLNLAIYKRQKVSSVPGKEYERFINNDEQLAEMYGKNILLFKKNKVRIDPERLHYDFIRLCNTREETSCIGDCEEQVLLAIQNPYELKLRPEKQISAVLGLTRSQIRKQMEQGEIKLLKTSPKLVSACIKKDFLRGSLLFPDKKI